jgi:hypothetical protein
VLLHIALLAIDWRVLAAVKFPHYKFPATVSKEETLLFLQLTNPTMQH